MTLETQDYALLGIAMVSTQKLEFALYGIAVHLTHLPGVASDSRFRALTPADFLSPLPEKRAIRKATLGQIARKLGPHLLFPADELEDYVARRNLIAHDFWREVASIKGSGMMANHRMYLVRFIKDTDRWLSAVRGVLSIMHEAAAKNEKREGEFHLTEDLLRHRETYYAIATKNLNQGA